ncbi:MAG: hypothetical protein U9Q37_07230 [Euryarchaeota archaeon]|nr:hypothetical protein [Euryarchaeota archaeon]
MDKPEPDLNFKLMALTFKLRDLFSPQKDILSEVGIRPGFCGSITAADQGAT